MARDPASEYTPEEMRRMRLDAASDARIEALVAAYGAAESLTTFLDEAIECDVRDVADLMVMAACIRALEIKVRKIIGGGGK